MCIAYGLGCPRASVDTARLFAYFERNGWKLTPRIKDASLVIVAVCAFDGLSERQSLHLLNRASVLMKPGARMVAVGCIAGICPERLQKLNRCIPIAATELPQLDRLVEATVPLETIPEVNDLDPLIGSAGRSFSRYDRSPLHQGLLITLSLLPRALRRRTRWGEGANNRKDRRPVFYIRTSRGCDNQCAYCAIRLAVGPHVSKPARNVLEEFRHGLQRGFERFQLVATDAGAYGRDTGSSLPELLEQVTDLPGRFDITLQDLHPKWVLSYRRCFENLVARRAGRFRTVVIPIQSGSDPILTAMKREHTSADTVDALRSLAARAPGVDLETHVLVGFPGETDDDFNATVAALEAVPYRRIVAYRYSDRPHTEAAQMTNKVPAAVIGRRVRALHRRFPERFF